MDVKPLSPKEWSSVSQTAQVEQQSGEAQAVNQLKSTPDFQKKDNADNNDSKDKKEYSLDDMLPITRELNQFLTYLNADIRFQLHEGTKQLIVQVVDQKENKVLREFPPHELLDTIANIREYIGILLDKKA